MMRNQLVNMALMQALWFAAVIGAAFELTWPALVTLIVFAGWQLQASGNKSNDMLLMLIALFLGLLLDTIWLRLGWIQYSEQWPIPGFAPLWILALWIGLALTLNHSLAWLQNKLLVAGLLSGLASPLSYLGAERLGAVAIIGEYWDWFFGLAVSWAFALSFLLWLSKYLSEYQQTENCDV